MIYMIGGGLALWWWLGKFEPGYRGTKAAKGTRDGI